MNKIWGPWSEDCWNFFICFFGYSGGESKAAVIDRLLQFLSLKQQIQN